MMRILVMEPDSANRRQLRALLERNGFEVFETTTAAGARQAQANRVLTVIADVALLADADLMAIADPIPVVIVTDSPSVNQAVECMRRGASDYLARPYEPEAMVAAVRNAASRSASGAAIAPDSSPMIGDCAPMHELRARIAAAARTTAPVLIQGEPGTGKELAARVLHDASDRRYARLIALNCATTPEPSIEPALFGYDVAPAAADQPSGGLAAAAHRGTLFIDRIDLMPMAAQSRLLRLFDENTAQATADASAIADASETVEPEPVEGGGLDVRLVVATHQDLRQLAANGHFHDHLLQRLAGTTLRLPPLRERGDDVEQIARAMLDRCSARLNKPGVKFASGAIRALRNHAWPGNVQELANAVAQATALCDGPFIDADLLGIHAAKDASTMDQQQPTSGSLEDFFVRFVLANQDQFTETELASQLGISRKSLWERRQRLNIPRRRTRKRGPRQPLAAFDGP